MKTLNATKCLAYCRSDNKQGMVFNACAADAADPIALETPRAPLDNLNNITSIDSAVQSTIATMPNALRLLENS